MKNQLAAQDTLPLPVRQPLGGVSRLSYLIVLLVLVVSISGLAFPAVVYPTEELVSTFLPNDLINLVVGLPVLLLSLWLVQRGNLIGLLFWPGALLFVFYNAVVYLFGLPFGPLSLAYLTLLGLSVFALVDLLSKIDQPAVRDRLEGKVPLGFGAGILVGLGVLMFLRSAGLIVTSLLNQDPMSATDLGLNLADALTAVAWLVGGGYLWCRHPFGYTIGLGLLYQSSMLFIALIFFLLLQPLLTPVPFVFADLLIILIMGSLCFIPFVLFLRGAARQ